MACFSLSPPSTTLSFDRRNNTRANRHSTSGSSRSRRACRRSNASSYLPAETQRQETLSQQSTFVGSTKLNGHDGTSSPSSADQLPSLESTFPPANLPLNRTSASSRCPVDPSLLLCRSFFCRPKSEETRTPSGGRRWGGTAAAENRSEYMSYARVEDSNRVPFPDGDRRSRNKANANLKSFWRTPVDLVCDQRSLAPFLHFKTVHRDLIGNMKFALMWLMVASITYLTGRVDAQVGTLPTIITIPFDKPTVGFTFMGYYPSYYTWLDDFMEEETKKWLTSNPGEEPSATTRTATPITSTTATTMTANTNALPRSNIPTLPRSNIPTPARTNTPTPPSSNVPILNVPSPSLIANGENTPLIQTNMTSSTIPTTSTTDELISTSSETNGSTSSSTVTVSNSSILNSIPLPTSTASSSMTEAPSDSVISIDTSTSSAMDSPPSSSPSMSSTPPISSPSPIPTYTATELPSEIESKTASASRNEPHISTTAEAVQETISGEPHTESPPQFPSPTEILPQVSTIPTIPSSVKAPEEVHSSNFAGTQTPTEITDSQMPSFTESQPQEKNPDIQLELGMTDDSLKTLLTMGGLPFGGEFETFNTKNSAGTGTPHVDPEFSSSRSTTEKQIPTLAGSNAEKQDNPQLETNPAILRESLESVLTMSGFPIGGGQVYSDSRNLQVSNSDPQFTTSVKTTRQTPSSTDQPRTQTTPQMQPNLEMLSDTLESMLNMGGVPFGGGEAPPNTKNFAGMGNSDKKSQSVSSTEATETQQFDLGGNPLPKQNKPQMQLNPEILSGSLESMLTMSGVPYGGGEAPPNTKNFAGMGTSDKKSQSVLSMEATETQQFDLGGNPLPKQYKPQMQLNPEILSGSLESMLTMSGVPYGGGEAPPNTKNFAGMVTSDKKSQSVSSMEATETQQFDLGGNPLPKQYNPQMPLNPEILSGSLESMLTMSGVPFRGGEAPPNTKNFAGMGTSDKKSQSVSSTEATETQQFDLGGNPLPKQYKPQMQLNPEILSGSLESMLTMSGVPYEGGEAPPSPNTKNFAGMGTSDKKYQSVSSMEATETQQFDLRGNPLSKQNKPQTELNPGMLSGSLDSLLTMSGMPFGIDAPPQYTNHKYSDETGTSDIKSHVTPPMSITPSEMDPTIFSNLDSALTMAGLTNYGEQHENIPFKKQDTLDARANTEMKTTPATDRSSSANGFHEFVERTSPDGKEASKNDAHEAALTEDVSHNTDDEEEEIIYLVEGMMKMLQKQLKPTPKANHEITAKLIDLKRAQEALKAMRTEQKD
ncbi:unnamed protein product [Cyprideis torosa]|uniref:Uncharacterized protein n=1 Tax=Cyprideis torosa TaxID=163714 RepID=A0A7R8W4B9_9CRUS|nr:unnamed protein product [Cyprideis torosa]CAG0881748.1 unnamed protein product [Cyprideis torosa]